jgi:hypothetical protein
MAVAAAEVGRRGSTRSIAFLAFHPENRNLDAPFTFFIASSFFLLPENYKLI